jgi:cell division protein FtsL
VADDKDDLTTKSSNTEIRVISRRNLTTTEWILILLFAMVSAYVFIEKVYRYGADTGIVSYVSFAGTIVSIILAVLAIVYSYYQNFSQQRDSSTIATQIDIRRQTVTDVRISKKEFSKELR